MCRTRYARGRVGSPEVRADRPRPLSHSVSRRRGSVSVSLFPLSYISPFFPRQPLLARMYTPFPYTRAPFRLSVSHIRPLSQPQPQWTGHSDADATGLQLRTLQRTLERLMSGEIAKVESTWQQKVTLNHNEVVPSKRWKAALPHCFVWMDYTSVPQPTAGALEQAMIPAEVSFPALFTTFIQIWAKRICAPTNLHPTHPPSLYISYLDTAASLIVSPNLLPSPRLIRSTRTTTARSTAPSSRRLCNDRVLRRRHLLSGPHLPAPGASTQRILPSWIQTNKQIESQTECSAPSTQITTARSTAPSLPRPLDAWTSPQIHPL